MLINKIKIKTMKKQLNEQMDRMQILAGIITENNEGEILDRLKGNVNSPVAMYSLILKVIELSNEGGYSKDEIAHAAETTIYNILKGGSKEPDFSDSEGY